MKMGKKTNIYLCVTEYHVLLSILLSIERFFSDEFENIIILCNEGRFNDKNRYNFSSINNVEYVVYPKEYVRSRDFIKEIISKITGTLFVFNLNNPHFIYIFYKLKQLKQANTAFVQEGLASYNFDHYTLRERIGRIKTDISILRESKIKNLSFYRYCFGYRGLGGKIFDYYDKAVGSSLVDSFWLTFPDEAKYGRDKAIRLPVFTKRSISAANKFFKYQQSLSLKENDIVFIDQRIIGSFEFVSELSISFPNTKIYIKLHPSTKKESTNEYKKIPNVCMLSSLQGIPVELFLQNLRHAIVVTPFSSALLINNPSCDYYYTYKWHLQHGYKIENDSLFTPGRHIRIIDSIGEIETF